MTVPTEHAQRWIWFLDVVFGAIVALGIEKYEPVIRDAWLQGIGSFTLSLVVTISVFSFVVYDIAVYHALAKKFPYQLSALGFARFYLDLVMAFVLYVLLANALQAHPDWIAILVTVSFWHLAATAWHLLARREHGAAGGIVSTVGPHVLFIITYWIVAFLASTFGTRVLGIDNGPLSNFILVVVSVTIFAVSLFRWNQVIRKIATQNA